MKKETLKWILQIIVAVCTAIITTLTTQSCSANLQLSVLKNNTQVGNTQDNNQKSSADSTKIELPKTN